MANHDTLQSQMDLLMTQKQKHEDFLSIEEPIVTEAREKFYNLKIERTDPPDQIKTQTKNLNKYLHVMMKSPQIANAKKQIIEITNKIEQMNNEMAPIPIVIPPNGLTDEASPPLVPKSNE